MGVAGDGEGGIADGIAHQVSKYEVSRMFCMTYALYCLLHSYPCRLRLSAMTMTAVSSTAFVVSSTLITVLQKVATPIIDA